MELPKQGMPRKEVAARILEKKAADADWRGGRTWSLIYPAGEDVDAVLRDANELYLFENALNPFRFPSLREMEGDVVSMTGGLVHAPEGFGGAMTSAMIYLGDNLGLYRALAGGDPVTSTELAKKTGLHERWLREWLYQQGASGVLDYEGEGRFSLSPEGEAVLADEDHPAGGKTR